MHTLSRMGSLSGKVALVTGASSGLGWETALQLVDQGARVCITARTREALDELSRIIHARGGEGHVLAADVTNDEQVRAVVEGCISRFGRIDLLINNAAVTAYAKFEQHSWKELQRIIDVNFFGYLRFAREVLPHLHAQKSGHIVNVLSVLSKTNMPYFGMYSASKHALLAWSETLRRELLETPIKVSAILMPAIATPLYDHVRTTLRWAPKPLPPIYSTEWAAKALVHRAANPKPMTAPSMLQGYLMIWSAHAFRRPADLFLRLFAERLQLRKGVPPPAHDNLFEPSRETRGPDGTLKPTPRWARWLPAFAAVTGSAVVARRLLSRA